MQQQPVHAKRMVRNQTGTMQACCALCNANAVA
jgi:hypothetical protein